MDKNQKNKFGLISTRRVSLFTIINFLIMFIVVFISPSSEKYILPYIFTSANIKYTLCMFLIALEVIIIKKYSLDNCTKMIVFLFSTRCMISIIHLFGTSEIDSEIKYLFSFICGICYLIAFSQSSIFVLKSNVVHHIVCYYVIICVQTIITYIIASRLHSGYFGLKSLLKIPIGASNYIECWILMLTAFLFYYKKNSKFRYAIFFIGFISSLLTRSKSAILIWSIWLLIIVFLVSKEKKGFGSFFTVAVTLIALLYFYDYLRELDFFDASNQVFDNLFSGDSDKIEKAFNGRFDTYKYAFDAFNENLFTFFLGKGASYSSGYTPAHNWILDILAKSGIVGLIVVIVLYTIIFKQLHSNSKTNDFAKPAIIMMVFVILNSMWEPCLDGFLFSIPYYTIIGFGIQQTDPKLDNDRG